MIWNKIHCTESENSWFGGEKDWKSKYKQDYNEQYSRQYCLQMHSLKYDKDES